MSDTPASDSLDEQTRLKAYRGDVDLVRIQCAQYEQLKRQALALERIATALEEQVWITKHGVVEG